MSTALPRQTVEKAIQKIANPSLRRWAREMFHRVIKVKEHGKIKRRGIDQQAGNWYRYGSDQKGRGYAEAGMPEMAVTPEDRAKMHELHKLGCSFREIEEIFHLYPQSGNGAQRCCDQHAEVRSGSKKLRVKSRMTKAMFIGIAKNFLKQQKPNKAKAVFKEIEAILPGESRRRVAAAV